MLPNLIFSNEKLFTVEAAFNHKNDRVLSKSLQDIPSGLKKVRKTQKSTPVMVWAAASSEGKSPLIFVPKGVKINKKVYIDKILKNGLMPWTSGMFSNANWTFQQDGATSHTANLTQQWCMDHCPVFISMRNNPQIVFFAVFVTYLHYHKYSYQKVKTVCYFF